MHGTITMTPKRLPKARNKTRKKAFSTLLHKNYLNGYKSEKNFYSRLSAE